jgi:hypothetical protein
MLVSCLRLNCHNIRARLPNANTGASTSGRAKRARPPLDEGEGDEEDGASEGTEDSSIPEIARGVGALGPKSKSKGKGKVRAKPKAEMATPATLTPARGRPRTRACARRPRSKQLGGSGSSKADSVKVPTAAVTLASRRSLRLGAKPRSAASSSPGKATSSPVASESRGGGQISC